MAVLRFFLFSIACFLALVFPALGGQHYFFSSYTISSGLPNNVVNGLFKDRDGFLWICTSNGLSRYDGINFKNYLFNPADSNSLPANQVQSICQDQQGFLWVGLKGGVARYDPRTEKFSRLRLDFYKGFDKVLSVFCDSRNRIWMNTWLGVYAFSASGRKLLHARAGTGPKDLLHDHTVAVFEDSRHQIWVSSQCGLSRFNEKDQTFSHFTNNNPPYLKNNGWKDNIQHITEDGDGTFWCGSWANGLREFNPQTGVYSSYIYQPGFAGHGAYNVIGDVKIFDRKIWVASHDKGLGIFDPVSDSFSFFRDHPSEGFSQPVKKTICLLPDGPILWIGTESGLFKLDSRKQYFGVHSLKGIKSGSCLPDIFSACLLPGSSGKLVLGSNTCGLFEYEPEKRLLSPSQSPDISEDANGWRMDFNHLMVSADSSLWMSTSHGLFIRKNGKLRCIKPGGEVRRIVSENYFFKALQAKDGTVWVASARGILKFTSPEAMPLIYLKQKIAPGMSDYVSDKILDVSETPDGDLWFLRQMGKEGGRIGFTVLRKKSGMFVTYAPGSGPFKNYPYPQTASNLTATSDGRIFVSSERGLVAFHSRSPGNFKSFTSYDGLLEDDSYEMVEDRSRRLWIRSYFGITCLDLKSHRCRTFSRADGLPDARLSGLCPLPDGRLVIGLGDEWLAFFNPGLPDKNIPTSSPMQFTSLTLEGKRVVASDSLELEPSVQVARFQFSPMNFLPASENLFQVLIEHNRKQSSYQTSQNEILLSDMSPGWYTIKVTDKEARQSLLHLYKKPRFWQTTWFLVLCLAGVFAAAALALLGYQRKKLRELEQARNLEFRLAEYQMTALRSQMNAHFIFNALNSINSLIWQQLPEKASHLLSQFARLMRLTLEHTRSGWIPLSEEIESLRAYVELESSRLGHPPVFSVTLPPDMDTGAVQIPPMLVQPLVENVFLHVLAMLPAPGELHIRVSRGGEGLWIDVEDNGPSFEGLSRPQVDKAHKSMASGIIADRLALLSRQMNFEASCTRFQEGGRTIVRLALPLVED